MYSPLFGAGVPYSHFLGGVLPFCLIPFRLIFAVSFRVNVCLGLGIGLGSGLGELGLGEMGLGEMGKCHTFWAYDRKNTSDFPSFSAHVSPSRKTFGGWGFAPETE